MVLRKAAQRAQLKVVLTAAMMAGRTGALWADPLVLKKADQKEQLKVAMMVDLWEQH